MKTILLCSFLVGLLFMGCTKNESDFDNPNNVQLKSASSSKGIIEKKTVEPCWFLLYCGDVQFDYLEGEMNCHWRTKLEKGEYKWSILTISGTITRPSTGEIFRVHETDFYDKHTMGIWKWHLNLQGDQGSHIINQFTADWNTMSYTIDKAICPPEN